MSQKQAEEEGLLADIVANPSEDGYRLVYADWCEDNGKAYRAGATRGEDWISDQAFTAWFGPRLPFVRGWPVIPSVATPGDQPDRFDVNGAWSFWVSLGFPERIRLPLADWMAHGKALIKEFPLRRVELADRDPIIDACSVWYWRRADERDSLDTVMSMKCHWLPVPVWGLLPRGEREDDIWMNYGSKAAAIDAASTACLKFASG